tara:strand:- start:1645 stop:2220 length:576 start_codon:yes stop_codon:yes gene_type:complete
MPVSRNPNQEYSSEYLADVEIRETATVNFQQYISANNEQSYDVVGTATLASGTVTALHIENTSTTENIFITYLRHQVIDAAGGTAFPNASNYFSLALGRTLSSGGSTVVPVNLYGGSSNVAEATVTTGAPTLSGTALEIDRWYTKAEADMNYLNKEGALILPPSQTLELSYVGDHTSGILYSQISLTMGDV